MLSFLNDYQGFAEFFTRRLEKLYPFADNRIEFISSDDPMRAADCDDLPFSSNSHTKIGGVFHIVYNKFWIQKLGFGSQEIWAIIAHELGHVLTKEDQDYYRPEIEIACDSVASNLGLGLYLASALIKMRHIIPEDCFNARIEALARAVTIYRPVWTCGRFVSDKKQAIFYNLVEGESYLFNSFSASVIGCILSLGRWGSTSIESIAKETMISPVSLFSFIVNLAGLGLVTLNLYSDEDVLRYRAAVKEARCDMALAAKSVVDRLNLDVSDAEVLYSEAVDDGHTVSAVMLELTYTCSESCIHCYNPGATRNKKEVSYRSNRVELTLEEYKNVIDQFIELGLIKVCLTGGDPFSKPIIWDIIDYLYQKDIAFDIYTNGQLLHGNEKRLADYYPRSVGISLYSGIPDDHDMITSVKGSWEKTMSVIASLSSLAVPMNLKCCVMQPNVKTYYMVADIAKEYGAVPQFELSITESNEGDMCPKRLRLNEKQLKVVLRDVQIPFYVGPSAKDYGRVTKQKDSAPCGTGHTSFCLTPDGYLRGCCAFPLDYGNVRDKSVSEILLNNVILEEWRETKISDYEECGVYDYCSFCNLCSGNNYIENGDYHKSSETNCYLAKCRSALAHELSGRNAPDLTRKELVDALQELEPDTIELFRDFRREKR